MFISPNISSLVSAVDRSRYGVVASLTHLIRNSADVTSIALATTVVVVIMGSRGVEPSLEAVSPQIADAFVSGLRWAFVLLGSILAMATVICMVRGDRPKPAGVSAVPATTAKPLGDFSSPDAGA